jgi:hypothetical protein
VLAGGSCCSLSRRRAARTPATSETAGIADKQGAVIVTAALPPRQDHGQHSASSGSVSGGWYGGSDGHGGTDGRLARRRLSGVCSAGF